MLPGTGLCRSTLGIEFLESKISGSDSDSSPWTVSIVNQQAIALFHCSMVGSHQGFGGGTLKKGTRLFVQAGAQEIVGRLDNFPDLPVIFQSRNGNAVSSFISFSTIFERTWDTPGSLKMKSSRNLL